MSETVGIPQQRNEENVKPPRVITTYVAVLTLDESIIRHGWRGKTKEEILAHIENEDKETQLKDFEIDLSSIALDDPNLLFVRHVKIVDVD